MNSLVEQPSQVNAGRQYPYATLGHWVLLHPDLSGQAVRLYGILRAHVNVRRNGTNLCNPLQEDLQAMTGGVDRKTIRRWTKELEKVGAIDVTEIRDPEAGTKRLVYEVHEAPPEDFTGTESIAQWYDIKRTVAGALRPNVLSGDDLPKQGHVASVPVGHVASVPVGHVASAPHKEAVSKNLKRRTTPPTVDNSPTTANDATENDALPDVPGARVGVCDGQETIENRERALDAIKRTIPAITRDRMNAADKHTLLGLCVDALTAGASPLALRECLETSGVDERTTHPMSRLTTSLTNLATRAATDAAERAERTARRRSACGRTDCREKQIICSADCDPGCTAEHDPVGVPCPRCCPGAAPTIAVNVPGIRVRPMTAAMLRDVARIIAAEEKRDAADVIATITRRAAELVAAGAAPEARTEAARLEIILTMVLAEDGRDWRRHGARLVAA